MLVIKCKEDDSIRIGDEITIKVTRLSSIGRAVSIGIDAPRHMVIDGGRGKRGRGHGTTAAEHKSGKAGVKA